MKLVVTGGTGLLGSALCEELKKRGHEITLLKRDELTNGIRKDLREIEGFIHLAGEGIADKRWSKNRKQALRDSRIETARVVVQKLKADQAPVRLVVTSSGISYYGDRGDQTITESDPPATDFIGQLCVDWEQATRSAFADARWVALRTAPVLSYHGGYLDQIVPKFKLLGASTLGSGRQFTSWIHMEDWVRLAVFCIENESANGPFNACAPEPVPNSDWTKMLQEEIGTYRNLPVPIFALKLAVGEVAEIIVASQKCLPFKAQELGFKFSFPQARMALHDVIEKRSR